MNDVERKQHEDLEGYLRNASDWRKSEAGHYFLPWILLANYAPRFTIKKQARPERGASKFGWAFYDHQSGEPVLEGWGETYTQARNYAAWYYKNEVNKV